MRENRNRERREGIWERLPLCGYWRKTVRLEEDVAVRDGVRPETPSFGYWSKPS
ncbi:hypothetical protein SESBI_08883 [Sesbania bispinosa]|nr:hypothetical protein SESBI_08883 [Sesbania bispinosa]